MKRTFVIGLIAALLLLVMVPAVAQDKAEDKKEVKKACCAKSSCQGIHACKNAKVEVKNIENGVKIIITAEKAEDVKAIQECAAKCSAHAAKCTKAEKASCAKTCTAEQKAKCAAAEKEKKAAGCQHGKDNKEKKDV